MTPQQLLAHFDTGRSGRETQRAGASDVAQAYQQQLALRQLRMRSRRTAARLQDRLHQPRHLAALQRVRADLGHGLEHHAGVLRRADGPGVAGAHLPAADRTRDRVRHARHAGGRAPSLDDLFDAIDWMAPGFEIVQSHLPDWKFAAADAVADGGLHARLLVGRRIAGARSGADAANAATPCWPARSWPAAQDGQAVERGVGANVLDGPLLALAAFPARTAPAARARPICMPGDVVTTGTWTDAWPVPPAQNWTCRLQRAAVARCRCGSNERRRAEPAPRDGTCRCRDRRRRGGGQRRRVFPVGTSGIHGLGAGARGRPDATPGARRPVRWPRSGTSSRRRATSACRSSAPVHRDRSRDHLAVDGVAPDVGFREAGYLFLATRRRAGGAAGQPCGAARSAASTWPCCDRQALAQRFPWLQTRGPGRRIAGPVRRRLARCPQPDAGVPAQGASRRAWSTARRGRRGLRRQGERIAAVQLDDGTRAGLRHGDQCRRHRCRGAGRNGRHRLAGAVAQALRVLLPFARATARAARW